VQAGLLDSFVQNTLLVGVDQMQSDLVDAIDELSKYTHITPAVFGIAGLPLDTIVTETLEAFLAFLEMIDDCRAAVANAVEGCARRALHDELLSTTVNELDQLATHYRVEDTQIETVSITSMDAAQIRFSVTGSVECEFQYGSGGDVSRGDGWVTTDSYPLTCAFEASITSPLQVTALRPTLEVDNNSFYSELPED
jgi:hypothetical protein